ncbi:MAG: type II secretion system F family protein [Jatrophihabitantaceae bacterium]
MSGALAWCLFAVAFLLVGRPNRDRARAHVALSSRATSPRVLRWAGAGGVALLLVALLGARLGLLSAIALGPLAAAVIGRLADRPARVGPAPGLALALDLAAVALRSGQSVASALQLAAPVLTGPVGAEWRRAAGLLALGADPEQAWDSMAEHPVLAPVAVTARRSAHSGARLARAFSQLATETRASRQAAAISRANRAGVFAMAPLGLCFLPAFICLGIVPTVAGIAGQVLSGVP